MKKALITGITGQDGSYLAELLLEKGYKVYGMTPRRSNCNFLNIQSIINDIDLIYGDLSDQTSIDNCIKKCLPDEVYNLGAQSFVKASWDLPEYTSNINGLGVMRLLEAIKNYQPKARFYQASTSEMYGNNIFHTFNEKEECISFQNEKTSFYPRSPYGVSKLYGHFITINYRESYSMFSCCGILFNHDSPRRGHEFVTQKIATAAAKIKLGLQEKLHLGNLDAQRDIGHAKDYVYAMWLMLQKNEPDDYVVATGETHSVSDILDVAFSYLNLNWRDHVVQDPIFMRPAEVNYLKGDFRKARECLGWQPKYNFKEIIEEMVIHQLNSAC